VVVSVEEIPVCLEHAKESADEKPSEFDPAHLQYATGKGDRGEDGHGMVEPSLQRIVRGKKRESNSSNILLSVILDI